MVLVKNEEEYELVGMGSKLKNTKELKLSEPFFSFQLNSP